ncbi:hypothetical protein [Aeromicrobium sp. UC242_57]|uniref:hypothetical protein n=1 Tax=Aeromicrobium sp. UC242_57 TaxID=3374624 RepID=UPI0037AA4EEC
MKTHKATFYAQVKAKRGYGTRNPDTGLRPVSEIRLAKTTQSYPGTRDTDTVIVKLTVEVPDTAFDPLLPNAVVTIPEGMTVHPIAVEADDANEVSE